MSRARTAAAITLTMPAVARGEVELIVDGQHLHRVVQEGIAKAKVSIAIMTADFKAMLVPVMGSRSGRSIIELFRQLAERGVEVRVLHSGVPSGPALRQLKKALPTGLTIRRCPRLHAKAVLIDCSAMYLGSANLTGAGLGAKSHRNRNFEMGVWTTSTTMIDAVHEQFNALWEGRHCPGCGRRDVCPVPLEEPRL
jgi:phosphatidylserine/phosphatidylglycerophosphate/cardiolipin synthase-like enzyme